MAKTSVKPSPETQGNDRTLQPAPERELTLARDLLRAESRAVAGLADLLDGEFTRAVEAIAQCAQRHGTVLVTGLGKSGLIGAKIAATLTSLGIPAHFVHPTEAAHGDLGNFRTHDVCIALSYSGETEEVIALAALLKQDGLPVIAISRGHAASGLAHAATISLALGPCEDDLSPAPMASTTATLALGDALALCASARLRFTDADFARRHPGGALGALMRPVAEILRFQVADGSLRPALETMSVAEALAASETTVRRPGAMLVVGAAGALVGLFTDADLRRLILKDPGTLQHPIARHMTRAPGTLPDTALVRDAVRMVREFRRDEIPVVDRAGRPVGLLDVQDLVAMKLVRE
ncbi:KpsF/GutQ family sugar-phosphate isomerase [soil metagenome]